MEFEDRIPKLIAGHLRNNLTASEQKELDDWVNKSEANRRFFREATDEKLMTEELYQFNKQDVTQRLNNTLKSIDPEAEIPEKSLLVRLKKYTIAASIILIGGATVFIWNRVSSKKEITQTKTYNIPTSDITLNQQSDVAPGTEKATLILSDGSKITLDSTANGTIAQQGNATVLKENGLLAYNSDKSKMQSKIFYNTLTTDKGQEFPSLVLSDGTKVWLNSVSSITYPTSFNSNERVVDVTGEAFFAVAKDARKPFRVNVNGMKIEVLGTQFNVNSYSDETAIKTSLLEGSVKIIADNKVSFLKPGQQASLRADGKIKITDDMNIDKVISWKNKSFYFSGDDLKTVMRQLSRWYDVDVAYEGNIANPTLSGMISRNRNLSEVLKALELNDIHFKIDGKKITVTQ